MTLTRLVALGAAALLGVAALNACGGGSTSVVRTSSPATSGGSSAPAPSSTPSSTATGSGSSGPTGQPAITVTPSTGLAATEAVQVVASGFSPGEALRVIQCAQKGQATGPGDCNLPAMQSATADEHGALRTTLTVVRGPFGANNIVCGPAQGCLVSVTQATLAPTEEADAPITFASG